MTGRLRNRGALVPSVLGILAFVVLLGWAGSDMYRGTLLITFLTYALIALGMYVPFVLAGSLSLAYSAYAATGAYAVAILADSYGWPLWAGLLVGPPVAAVVAVLLGAATRRLSGFYLGAVTLLFAEAFAQLLGNLHITGGATGIVSLPVLTIAGWMPSIQQTVLMASALTVVVTIALDRLRRSPWGVMVRTANEVPIAVDTAGVSVATLNLIALGIGAAIASVGGAIFAAYNGAVNPETFGVNVIFLAIFMPLIGGVISPWGCVLGAGIVVDITLNVDALSSSGTLVVALCVLIILIAFPRGLLGFGTALSRQVDLVLSQKRGAR